jgi:ABC-type spermidine/putrescine transport system permease subunit I
LSLAEGHASMAATRTGASRANLDAMIGLAPIMLVLAVFLVGPIWVNLLESLKGPAGTGLHQYGRIFGDGYYLTVIAQTLAFGLAVTAICTLLGYPLAYAVARSEGAWKAALILLVVTPLMVNVVVRSFGWMVILGGSGAVNAGLQALGLPKAELMYNWTGVTIAMVHVLLPFMVLSIASTLETLDRRLEEAAAVLGATPARIFRHVTLPLSLEGIVTGAILCFTLAIGSFVTVLLLGKTSTMVLPLLIYQQLTTSSDWPFAAAMGMVLLVLVSLVLWAQGRLRPRAARAARA